MAPPSVASATSSATHKSAVPRLAGRYEVQFPIHYAARNGDWRRLEGLLSKSVYAQQVELKDPDGLSPLSIAAEYGHVKVRMWGMHSCLLCTHIF